MSAPAETNGARLAVTPRQAAELLSVSHDYFRTWILPELRTVRRGRRVIVAVAELERWLSRQAAVGVEADRR